MRLGGKLVARRTEPARSRYRRPLALCPSHGVLGNYSRKGERAASVRIVVDKSNSHWESFTRGWAGGRRQYRHFGVQRDVAPKRAHPSRGIRLPDGMTGSGDELRCRQILPGRAGAFQLEYTALIRMEEILSIGNPVGILRTHHALGPPSRGRPSSMLLFRGNHMDAIIYTILDPRRPSRDQTSASHALMSCHTVYDAPDAFLVPL